MKTVSIAVGEKITLIFHGFTSDEKGNSLSELLSVSETVLLREAGVYAEYAVLKNMPCKVFVEKEYISRAGTGKARGEFILSDS